MPKEVVHGIELYYELNGKAEETVVMLNGIMMSTADWYDFVPTYTKNYRLLRVDFRNQGQSQYVEEDFLIEVNAEDLKGLLDKLGIRKVHMVGISYGAQVAMLFALKHQEMLHSLVLSNTAARVTKHLRAIGDSWEEAARLYDGEKFFKLVMPFLYSSVFYDTHWQWLKKREKAFGRILKKPWFDAYIKLSGSTRSYDILDQLHQIKVPALCIASDLDIITPLSEVRMIHEALEGSRFLILPNAGHASCYEKKEEFNAAVLGFVEGIGG
jgi:3-oxoadipate enol-lactonase